MSSKYQELDSYLVALFDLKKGKTGKGAPLSRKLEISIAPSLVTLLCDVVLTQTTVYSSLASRYKS